MRAGILIAACAAIGCSDDVVAPRSDQPFVYLVLNQTVPPGAPQRQTAFLLTTGSPVRSAYRNAERFDMRRVSDGARFDWQSLGLTGEAPVSVSSANLVFGNYVLSDSATVRGLGFENLRPRERYRLDIQTHGVAIRGSATIPDTFSLSIQRTEGRGLVVWPQVEGAAGYTVQAGGEPAVIHGQSDTTFSIPADLVGRFVVVRALDPHTFQYVTSEDVGRAGINAGFGLFGAITEARIELGR